MKPDAEMVDWNIDGGERRDFFGCIKEFLDFYDDILDHPRGDTIWYSTSSPTTWSTPWTLERGRNALMEIQKYRLRKSKHRKFTH